MDNLMNRCRAFAEGVVVMVCPVLLALALKKVDLEREEHGPAFPIVMLVIAGFTLIFGICPVLACCFSKIFPTAGVIPTPVTRWLTPFSSTFLLVLACLIAQLIISKSIVIPIGTIVGVVCIVIRTVCYYCYAQNDGAIARQAAEAPNTIARQEAEFYSTLDNSLEFLSGVTGILFLELEGLALEGQISSSEGIQHCLLAPMVISFVLCAFGVSFMLLEMIPPLPATRTNIARFAVFLDGFMAIGAVAVLVVIMFKSMEYQALLLLTPAFLIFLQLVLEQCAGGINTNNSEPASLELTKVTFTGFLAVSIATVSSGLPNKCGSPNKLTDWFLLVAAGAIVSGLAWRFLTNFKSETTVETDETADVASSTLFTVKTANVACFCTHFCVAIATILFVVMAWKALS